MAIIIVIFFGQHSDQLQDDIEVVVVAKVKAKVGRERSFDGIGEINAKSKELDRRLSWMFQFHLFLHLSPAFAMLSHYDTVLLARMRERVRVRVRTKA